LLFLDKIDAEASRYKTVEGDQLIGAPDRATEVRALCSGKKRASEIVELRDGRHLAREWGERRRLLEETGARGEGLIPWDQLDPTTISWFVGKFSPGTIAPNAEAICEHLLDGRTSINAHERRQLIILFGKDAAVREELRRDIADLQVISDPNARWDDRLLIDRGNVFGALWQAIEFLAKHLSSVELTLDGLSQRAGSPDYIAVREALVNQLIHQDYGDQRSCARIAIRPDQTEFGNPGYSLTAPERLEQGGVHQSRNPLVARAFRLVGFAESAGSGLRVLHGAWRSAHRPAPVVSSDRETNSFVLTLDWQPAADSYDEKWLKRGIKLTAAQAEIFRLVGEGTGLTLNMLCERLGKPPEAVEADAAHLVLQALLEIKDDRYVIAPHWRELS
jgi:hypothetical protein